MGDDEHARGLLLHASVSTAIDGLVENYPAKTDNRSRQHDGFRPAIRLRAAELHHADTGILLQHFDNIDVKPPGRNGRTEPHWMGNRYAKNGAGTSYPVWSRISQCGPVQPSSVFLNRV